MGFDGGQSGHKAHLKLLHTDGTSTSLPSKFHILRLRQAKHWYLLVLVVVVMEILSCAKGRYRSDIADGLISLKTAKKLFPNQF